MRAVSAKALYILLLYMLLPFLGDHHLHEITQGAAALYPGLCAFALTARQLQNERYFTGKPFPVNICGSKALRWRLQSFALAIAKLCVGSCKALRWRLQSFAPEVG